MRSPVYNSAILTMKSANHASHFAPPAHAGLCLLFLFLFPLYTLGLPATNWIDPERQLAQKIVAITGPGAVALTVDNRSSLAKKESDIIGDGMRSALESLGLRFVAADRAAGTVAITLSENQTSYVWVAEVHQGAGERTIIMVSIPRPEGAPSGRDSAPLVLHKTSLWQEPERILDVAVLEEGAIPTHIAVLNPEQVTLYRWRGEKWEPEQALSISHARPWPRDLRGRLILAKDHLLDVYLPGVLCRTVSGGAQSLSCRESDDPWPLAGRPLGAGTGTDSFPGSNGTALIPPLNAFFAPARNFFTGAVSPRIGKFDTVPKFYSLAFIPRDRYVLWFFATADGQIHVIDGMSDGTLKQGRDKRAWGSNLATVHTSCGAGWQVLAVTGGEDDSKNSVQAYELPDRDPIAVSSVVEVAGEVTSLWTEGNGQSAIAVARHRNTGEYEAFRLSLACSQ
ncbi:MAG: hypothetical protein WB729_02360 [Candidatus Sulfotelmatobacter sp.]